MFKEASIILIFVDLVLEQNMKQSKKDVSVNILWNKKLGIWNVECSGEQVSGVSEATAFRGPVHCPCAAGADRRASLV